MLHLGFGHVHNHSMLKSANSLFHFLNSFRGKFSLNEFKKNGMWNAEGVSQTLDSSDCGYAFITLNATNVKGISGGVRDGRNPF